VGRVLAEIGHISSKPFPSNPRRVEAQTESSVVSSTKLVTVAKEIDRLLLEVIALQKKHVEKVCPTCETPCCRRVGRLFDEKDLIFAKVLGLNGIPNRKHKGKKGCSHLSPTGCLLEPRRRPFTCHRYLCPELKEEMARKNPDLVSTLEGKFRTIERLRGQLFGEFLQIQGKRDIHR
jgi:hypothetical protein